MDHAGGWWEAEDPGWKWPREIKPDLSKWFDEVSKDNSNWHEVENEHGHTEWKMKDEGDQNWVAYYYKGRTRHDGANFGTRLEFQNLNMKLGNKR